MASFAAVEDIGDLHGLEIYDGFFCEPAALLLLSFCCVSPDEYRGPRSLVRLELCWALCSRVCKWELDCILERDNNICKKLIINGILKNESFYSLKLSHIFELGIVS